MIKRNRIILAVVCLLFSGGAYAEDFQHRVQVDKELSPQWIDGLYAKGVRTVYQGQELTMIGMPCGGICAGQLYVRGDGTLARWWIANNAYNTGYGIDHLTEFETALGPIKVCYKAETPPSFIDQGFTVRVKHSNTLVQKTLSKADFDKIAFVGEYPLARIQYRDRAGFPVEIDSEVFSPFIPLNAKDSAIPGTILKHTITNTSGGAIEVELEGWLQNLVCLELQGKIVAQSRNSVMKGPGRTLIVFSLQREKIKETPYVVFEDFDGGDYAGWSATGDAFGRAPAQGTLANQSQVSGFNGGLVNTYLKGDKTTGKLASRDFYIDHKYIVFKIGGGRHPGQCGFNLLVDDKRVLSATGKNSEVLKYCAWDVSQYQGKIARFEIVDQATDAWGHVNVDEILFGDDTSITMGEFDENHPYYGNVCLTVLDAQAQATADREISGVSEKAVTLGDKLVGGLTSRFTLKAGESKAVTYLLTWYFPNRPKNYGGGGNWNRPIPTVGPAIGNMYANWFDSSVAVADYLQTNLASLTQQTYLFHDVYYNQQTLPYWLLHRLMMPVSTLASETCQWWKNDRFWGWEGVGSCVGTCTHVWTYEQALARLFPELERKVREKQDFGTSFNPKDGGIATRDGWGGDHLDGHAGAILKSYREHLMTTDNAFLQRNWEKIKKGMGYLVALDGNDNGLIEGNQPNTYDISFYGANTYVGGLYLAALKACAEMADRMGDDSLAFRCRLIAKRGWENSLDKLWNGEYFIQDTTREAHSRYQYWDGCLADQMFGQSWAHQLKLGHIYPQDKVRSALQSIWKYNWTPDVGPQNQVYPPERYYATAGESGLFICTWPNSKHPGHDGVRYRNEVWTGIEYQVAASMINEDMLDQGLSIIRGVHERYVPEKHNPWNEVECGDHYARAMASWGCLVAIQDYDYDGPAGKLGFAPKLTPENSRTFFTAAEGWGTISQKRSPDKQINRVSVKYGHLSVQGLRFEAPKQQYVSRLTVQLGDQTIPAIFRQAGVHLTIDLERKYRIDADQVFRVQMDLN